MSFYNIKPRQPYSSEASTLTSISPSIYTRSIYTPAKSTEFITSPPSRSRAQTHGDENLSFEKFKIEVHRQRTDLESYKVPETYKSPRSRPPGGYSNDYMQPYSTNVQARSVKTASNTLSKKARKIGLKELELDDLSEDDCSPVNNHPVKTDTLESPLKKTMHDVQYSQTFSAASSFIHGFSFPDSPERSLITTEIVPEDGILPKSPSFLKPKLIASPKREVMFSSCFLKEEKQRKAFLDINILECITSYLNCKDTMNFQQVYYVYRREKLYKKVFKMRIREILIKGLDQEEQYEFWDYFVNFKKLKKYRPLSFTRGATRKCPSTNDIQKDLDRTLPDYDKYTTIDGQDSLFRVLTAVGNTVKDVGYVQGLNSIAGALLFSLKEEEAYWLMIYMLERLHIKDILKDNFSRIRVLTYQFETFLENYLPDIAEYFQKNSMTTDYFTSPWFITLFSQCLTVSDAIHVWNFLFTKGNSILIQFSLAIFSKYKYTILNMDFDNVGSFLKDILKSQSHQNHPYYDSLFKIATTFKITKRLMTELESYYYKGKPKLELIYGGGRKPQWRVKSYSDKILQSLNDLNLTEMDGDCHTPSFKKLDHSQQKGEIVGSLVNILTVSLPGTFKKIFKKGQSLSNVYAQDRMTPINSGDSGVILNHTHDLAPTKDTRSIRYAEERRKKIRGVTVADLKSVSPPKRNNLAEISEDPYLNEAAIKEEGYGDTDRDVGDDMKSSAKPLPSSTQSYYHNLLQEDFKSSKETKSLPVAYENPFFKRTSEDRVLSPGRIFACEQTSPKVYTSPDFHSINRFSEKKHHTFEGIDNSLQSKGVERKTYGNAPKISFYTPKSRYLGKSDF